MRKNTALAVNISAARGLQDVLKTNLGPQGTMKMLVSGAGQIKITKDGNTLLGEMQIQHPSASLIARAATAIDDMTGDGSTTTVLIIGEMLRQCEHHIQDGLHPRLLTEGFEMAKVEAINFLKSKSMFVSLPPPAMSHADPTAPFSFRELLVNVARTALSTKVSSGMHDSLAASVCDAVLMIHGQPTAERDEIDLHMVEVMHMKHRMGNETTLVRGLVLDHGGRSNEMPKRLENCYVLVCNVSLEYERSELSGGFYYSEPQKKAAMAAAERRVTDEKVHHIIELKRRVCTASSGKSFVVINQKGIDPLSLEMLARENILALRRAKRRNMERLVLACGGEAVNSTENLTADVLGEAGLVHEHTVGDEKYTFVENVKCGKSCTLLIKGSSDHSIAQIRDAIRDGLRAVKNALEDGGVLPGAGAFELACSDHLMRFAESSVVGKPKIGVRAFAEALLVVPKLLAENSGHDIQASLIALQDAYLRTRGTGAHNFVGFDVTTGQHMNPLDGGVFDTFAVKKSILDNAGVIATQLLLVDEIMQAGRRSAPAGSPGDE